jgi:hypothetical protein
LLFNCFAKGQNTQIVLNSGGLVESGSIGSDKKKDMLA